MKWVNTSPEEIIAKWVARGDPTRMLDLSCWHLEDFPDIPDEVERLDLRNCSMKQIPKLPKNLKWLNINTSTVETLPLPLPPNLEFLDCRWCSELAPFEIPTHIKVKSHFQCVLDEKERETHDAAYFIQKWIAEGNPGKELNLSRLNLTELPPLPDTVRRLNCGWNPIKSLHNLPRDLRKLNCNSTEITHFENVPPFLRCLECGDTKLTHFGNLPNTLRRVDCSFTSLKNLDGLPDSVRYIRAEECNNLENVHTFPAELLRISFNDSCIKSLANIPDKVECIDMCICGIKSIPKLPESLRFFRCQSTSGLTHITNIPSKLEVLDITANLLSELPPLPKTLRYFCTYSRYENKALNDYLQKMGINEDSFISERYKIGHYLRI